MRARELSTRPIKSRNMFPWLSWQPAGGGWAAACPDPIAQAQSEWTGQTLAEGPPLQTKPHEHTFLSCIHWARSSGTLRPQDPAGQTT